VPGGSSSPEPDRTFREDETGIASEKQADTADDALALDVAKDRTKGPKSFENSTKSNVLSVVIMLLLAAVVSVAGVCGSGSNSFTKESSPSSAPKIASQKQFVTDFINSITLTGLMLPNFNRSGDLLTGTWDVYHILPEETALEWLIDGDAVALVPDSAVHKLRLTQRYALFTLLRETNNDDYSGVSECDWPGVVYTTMNLSDSGSDDDDRTDNELQGAVQVITDFTPWQQRFFATIWFHSHRFGSLDQSGPL
jgi:hypothetical protein